MAVIVTQFSVNTGEKIYLSGEFIPGLSKEEEKALVDAGHCRYPDVAVEPDGSAPSQDDLPEGMKHLGGGYYELSTGDKVRGKDKAIEAQEKLNAEAQQPDGEPADSGAGPLTELPE